jgi:hypothetical protein
VDGFIIAQCRAGVNALALVMGLLSHCFTVPVCAPGVGWFRPVRLRQLVWQMERHMAGSIRGQGLLRLLRGVTGTDLAGAAGCL